MAFSQHRKPKKLTISAMFFALVLAFMFLGALDFVNRYFVCLFAAALIFLLTPGRKFNFTPTLVLLLAFSTMVLLFNPDSQKMLTNTVKPYLGPLCYLVGCSILQWKREPFSLEKSEKRFGWIILSPALGALLHFFLNMLTNRNLSSDRREDLVDVWTGAEMSATAQAALATMAIGVAAAYLFSKTGVWKKIFAALSLVLVLSYNLVLAGRTAFFLLAIMLALAALFFGVEKRRFLRMIILILVLVLILVLLYNANVFGVRTAVENSNFYHRFYGADDAQAIDDDQRFLHKGEYLKRLWKYPFGGENIHKEYGHSAHDLYLDTYDESGVFAMLAIVAYIITSLIRMARFIRNKRFSFASRQLVFCFYIVVNIQFCLEPIMRGMPWLLAVYCLVDGAVAYLLAEEKRTRGLRAN